MKRFARRLVIATIVATVLGLGAGGVAYADNCSNAQDTQNCNAAINAVAWGAAVAAAGAAAAAGTALSSIPTKEIPVKAGDPESEKGRREENCQDGLAQLQSMASEITARFDALLIEEGMHMVQSYRTLYDRWMAECAALLPGRPPSPDRWNNVKSCDERLAELNQLTRDYERSNDLAREIQEAERECEDLQHVPEVLKTADNYLQWANAWTYTYYAFAAAPRTLYDWFKGQVSYLTDGGKLVAPLTGVAGALGYGKTPQLISSITGLGAEGVAFASSCVSAAAGGLAVVVYAGTSGVGEQADEIRARCRSLNQQCQETVLAYNDAHRRVVELRERYANEPLSFESQYQLYQRIESLRLQLKIGCPSTAIPEGYLPGPRGVGFWTPQTPLPAWPWSGPPYNLGGPGRPMGPPGPPTMSAW